MRVLPARGSIEWRKLCLDLSILLAGFTMISVQWAHGGGGIPHNKYRPSTLVGLWHPEMALQQRSGKRFRTGFFFEAYYDVLQTGDAYSAEEKHIEPARAVVRIVLASVPQLVTGLWEYASSFPLSRTAKHLLYPL